MFTIILLILEQSFLYFPLILGAYCSISLMKIPDLSIEAAFVFGAIFASKTLIASNNLPLVIFASLLGGLVVGCISSCLTQEAKIPHLLSSIITIGLFHGINQFVLGNPNVSLAEQHNILETFNLLKQNPEIIMLGTIFIMLTIIGFLFLKTQLGYSLAVYGNNPHFFENHGISTKFVFFCGVMIANGLAGLSGYLVAQSSGFVDINMGFGMALFCITSLILGKSFFQTKKVFSITIPIVGIISYFSIQQLLLQAGFNLKYFTMIQSALVLIILIRTKQKELAKTGEIKIDNLGI